MFSVASFKNFDFSKIDFSVILKNDNFTTSGNTVKVVNLKGTQDGTDFWFGNFWVTCENIAFGNERNVGKMVFCGSRNLPLSNFKLQQQFLTSFLP